MIKRLRPRLVRPIAASAIIVLAALPPAVAQQQPDSSTRQLPEMRSTVPLLGMRHGEDFRPSAWRLAPEYAPDVYEAPLPDGRPTRVAFVSDVDSIAFLVEEGREYDFVVVKDGVRHWTRIVGRRFVPRARFDSAYQAANRGRIEIEIPEAYELANVAIALTPTAIETYGLVYQKSQYYEEMRRWFDPHAGHPVIAQLDSVLRLDANRYHSLKMNGRAFELDAEGRLVKSAVYDRTGFDGEPSNVLEPFAAGLEDFARASNFRRFYAAHRDLYAGQIAFYRDTANIAAMQTWLSNHFPGAKPYDSYRIVFSPLVAYNQSATWFESDGFSELMPHVNFPYAQDLQERHGTTALSDSAAVLLRGIIVFTEINHGYINPEADRYAERIAAAVSNRDLWVDPAMGPNYYGGNGIFTEYMNWALINLRFADFAPPAERDSLIARIDRSMVEGRKFPHFAEFSRFLVPLYVGRGERTLAQLYPEIIAWFERENAGGAARRVR